MTTLPIERNAGLALGSDQIESEIKEMRGLMDFVPDKENIDDVIKLATKSRKLFNNIEKTRKKAKEPSILEGKAIDILAKGYQHEVEEFALSFWDAKKERANADKIKKQQFEDSLQTKIDNIKKKVSDCLGKDSEGVKVNLVWLMELDATEGFYHRTDDALEARRAAIDHVKIILEGELSKEALAKIKAKEEAEKAPEPVSNKPETVDQFKLAPWEQKPEELITTDTLSEDIAKWFNESHVSEDDRCLLISILNRHGIEARHLIPEISSEDVPY